MFSSIGAQNAILQRVNRNPLVHITILCNRINYGENKYFGGKTNLLLQPRKLAYPMQYHRACQSNEFDATKLSSMCNPMVKELY